MDKIKRLADFDLSAATLNMQADLKVRPASSTVTLPKSFPEANLFALMKALFGRPRGFMSLVLSSKGDPDAPFKYQFSLLLPDNTTLEITRSWLDIEVSRPEAKLDVEDVQRMFIYNFKLHQKELDEAFASLEPYRLTINPHYRHKRMMQYFLNELRSSHVKAPKSPESLRSRTQTEAKQFGKVLTQYHKEMERQNTIASSLVTEAAFVAESYMNMLLMLLKNNVLRGNEGMLNKVLHEPWREKLTRLPLHCLYFTKTPDLADEAFKKLDRVFKLRNKIAHSAPDKDDLCFAKIWFDDQIPILPRCESYLGYQAGVDEVLPTRDEALELPSIVEKAIDHLMQHIDPKLHQEINVFMQANPIGYSEKTGNYGVPFGNDISFVLFGGNQASSAAVPQS